MLFSYRVGELAAKLSIESTPDACGLPVGGDEQA